MTEADSILVIEQPEDQTCAAIGGIMATRMKIRGVMGCVVSGRVRDLAELANSGLPVGFPTFSFPGLRYPHDHAALITHTCRLPGPASTSTM